MGYTGEGKDRNIWKGRLGVTEFNPKVANDLTTKNYVDGEIATIPVVTDYWKTTTAQTGLTGDKTGSFDLTTTGNIEGTGTANVLVIPTSDPSVAGAIWNDAGTLKVSAG